jgi:hypothetical protein
MKKYLISFILLVSSIIGYSQSYLGETNVLGGISDATTRVAFPFVAPAIGTLDQVCFYYNISGLSDRKVLVAVYDNGMTLNPTTRMGVTDTIVLTSSSGWKCEPLLTKTASINTNDTIWLSIVSDKSLFLARSDVNGSIGINRKAASSNAAFINGMPTPFGTTTSSAGSASIYAHYTSETSNYNPVTGRDVRPSYKGVEQRPSSSGNIVYFKKKAPKSTSNLSGIEYKLSLDFESWTTATVQSKDSLERRISSSWFNHIPSQHSIVNAGGTHGNVWQAMMPSGGKQGFQNYIHLNDTATDLYFQFDLYVQSDFNQVGTLGSSGKFPGGYFMGNSLDVSSDTVTVNGRSGHIHNVWGSTNMMIYTYDQDHSGYACGSCGTYPIPRGYWQTKTMHLNVGTPGNHDGFFEVFIDGNLVAQMTGLKFRSVTQGIDFGKIEGLYNSYQFGGAGDWFSLQNQYMRWDNLLVINILPSSEYYVSGPSPSNRVIPVFTLPYSELVPSDILLDESYTALTDTIFDVGNSYILNPPNKRDLFTKTVTIPSGTIDFTFLREEFGYYESGDFNSNYWIKVYKWTAGVKDATPTWTFGRSEVSGLTNPTGTYQSGTNKLSFEYNIGYNSYDSRGTAIIYQQH